MKQVLRPKSTIFANFLIEISIFHQKYEKLLKTNQNLPKTADYHPEQLVLVLGYQYLSILPQKRPKKPKFKIQKLSPPTTKML